MSNTVTKEGLHPEGAAPGASLRPFFQEMYDGCNVQPPAWIDDFEWPRIIY
jgi:hypothetical protein